MSRLVKQLALAVFSVLAMLVLLAAGLWWWAGTDGSLATALRWADSYAPQLTKNLIVQNPSGSLRAGGHVDRIIWRQDGLSVDAHDVTLAWQPWALTGGMLKLDSLAAASVLIDDQQAKTLDAKPPKSLRIPVRVLLDSFAIAQLNVAGEAAFSASNIAGNYGFDGQQHALELSRATVASGNYRGQATLAADAPFALTTALAGTVAAALPDSQQPLLLSFEATARGPLADVQARASLHINGAIGKATATQPQASITARITAWAAQPLPQADAVFQNLNTAVLWPGAPQTALTGSASVAPITSSTAAWAMQVQATNRVPGPWDKSRLPIDKLALSAEWRDGMALVKSLNAYLGGGQLLASGQSAGTQTWAFQVALKNVNPQALYSPLAALPLEGQAKGSWDARLAGGTLALSTLNLKTREAELGGTLLFVPSARGGKADLNLTAPGLVAKVQGELRKTKGKGDLTVRAQNAALALRWLQKLPGVPAALQGLTAAGNGELAAAWQGGWQDPSLQARLNLATLDVTPTPKASSVTPNIFKFRTVQASVNGKLSQASITAQGRLEAGQRRYTLQAAADGGKNNAGWQGLLRQVTLRMEDPILSAGTWQLATRSGVPLKWSAGVFEAGSGEALLAAPTTGAPAVVAWQPVKWQAGQLTTAGKVTGLPMGWIELITGPQTAGIGLAGNLIFEGAWDAKFGDTLTLKANLNRSSGDITVQPEGTQGAGARLAAGVQEARLSLDSAGQALTLALRWNSERAGTVDGQLTTRLARDASGSWQWPQDAALAGQIKAQLPRIGVWSALAPPGWRLRGSLGAEVVVSGTRAAPQLTGNLQANDLALRSVVDGIEFGNGQLRAKLDGSRMRITEFTLQGAGDKGTGGTLTAQGEAAWVNNQPSVTLDAKLDRLRASLRSDRQVTLSGNLQATLAGKQTQLTGNLKVDQARFMLPEEGVPQLGNDVVVRGAATVKKAGDSVVPKMSKPVDERTFKLGIQLDLGQDLRVTGKGLNTLLRGTLVLTGDSLSQPRLVGSVNTFAGNYRAYGQQLDVERGALRFTGPLDNPSLDILAIRPNLAQGGQRVGVQILGTALLPRVSLYAQPDLPDAEKLSWLVLGRASATGGGEAALLQQAAVALLGSKNGGMSGGLAASLGLDELSYRGASSNTDGTTSEGSVTLGKRFSRNFYAAYERSVSGALGTLFVFYDLSQRFTLRAQSGQQSAVDLIFTVPFD